MKLIFRTLPLVGMMSLVVFSSAMFNGEKEEGSSSLPTVPLSMPQNTPLTPVGSPGGESMDGFEGTDEELASFLQYLEEEEGDFSTTSFPPSLEGSIQGAAPIAVTGFSQQGSEEEEWASPVEMMKIAIVELVQSVGPSLEGMSEEEIENFWCNTIQIFGSENVKKILETLGVSTLKEGARKLMSWHMQGA